MPHRTEDSTRVRSLLLPVTLALGLAAGAPAPNQAQTVDGRVRDDVGGTPVAGTLVVLMDTAGNEFMRTESDAAGAFRFRVPAAGRYMLYAQRMGYGPLLSRPLEVRKDTLGVELRMIPDPVPLEPVVRLDELVHPSDISAIELYPSGAGAPARWSGMDAGCGVIMVWTKRRRP